MTRNSVGLAPSRALKRIAEALVRRVRGVVRVQNEIEVAAPDPREPLWSRITSPLVSGARP